MRNTRSFKKDHWANNQHYYSKPIVMKYTGDQNLDIDMIGSILFIASRVLQCIYNGGPDNLRFIRYGR